MGAMVGTTWPLSGRADDIAQVLALVEGDGAGVLLVGAAGVGKSRLADEIASTLTIRGGHVARLSGSAATSVVPFAAAASILPADVASAGLPALTSFRRALAAAADGRATTLVVDDVHLLDEASATLVHQAVVSGEATVVATQRSGTVAPDVVERLWWDGLVARLEVAPLPRADAERLAAHIAGRPLDPHRADRLWALTEGNPLFVRELLLAERESGALDDAVPKLADLVHRRLAGLAPEARDLLRAIAFGEPLGAGELDHLGPSHTLVELERAGLIAADPDERRLVVRVVHPFYGEVLRAETPPEERKAIMYRLAEGLLATGARRRGDLVRLATWSVVSGLEVEPEVLSRAARIALFSRDDELAETLAREAYRREPTAWMGMVLADVHYEVGLAAETQALLVELSERATTDAERARIGTLRTTSQFWHAGDAEGAFAALEQVAALGGEWEAEAGRVKATLLAFSGECDRAVAIAVDVLDRLPPTGRLQAAVALSQGLRSQALPVQAVAVVDGVLQAVTGLDDDAQRTVRREVGAMRVANMVEAGLLAEAEQEAELIAQVTEEMGESARAGHTLLSEGWLRLHQGRTAAAVDALGASARSFELMGHWGMRRWAQGALALAHAQRGEADRAGAALAAVDAADHPARVFDSAIHRARAWLAWLDGDLDEAERLLMAGADELGGRGDRTGEVACLHDVVRLGRVAHVHDRLTSVLDAAEGEWFRLLGAHTRAVASRSAADLGAAAEGFAAIGAWLLASEAAHGADEAAREAGDPRAATAWARQGEQWRDRCDEVRSPGLVAASAPVPLTRREREVAQLAADGVPRKEMADRLFVGVRTVDSHLVRIYAKLGVRNRAELADALAS